MERFSWERIAGVYTALITDIGTSSWAIRGLMIGLASVMSLFVILFAVYLSQGKSLRVARGMEIYRYLIRRLGLSRSERQMTDRISSFYRPQEKRYMVLIDEADFDDCVARAEEHGVLEEITLSALRPKLDFGAGKPNEMLGSSAELSPGTPVIVVQKGRSSIRGKVGSRDEQALVVTLDPGVEPPTLGIPISLYFHSTEGVFVFLTYARQLVKNNIYVDHSDVIRPTQRRRYYRKAIKLPVYVMLRDKLEEPIRSAFIDVSGGGASLENPGMDVAPGDDLALSFSSGGERFTVPARVVRLSGDGRVMHVQFQRLSETARDRLIGSLFKEQGRA
jgi:hypothetical protein